MNELKIRILIGTCEDAIFDHFSILLKHHLKSRGEVEISRADRCDACADLAVSTEFDLILLVVNTILPGRGYRDSIFDNSIQLVKTVKAANPAMLIALTTIADWPNDLLSAGANACLLLPCSIADITAAVDRGLAEPSEVSANNVKPAPATNRKCVTGTGRHLRRRHEPQNQSPVRIVVVDDEDWFVESVEILLRSSYDAALTLFTSSPAAWSELQRAEPDMLIVGGMMPQISGEMLVREAMARGARYPILVVSGFLNGDTVLRWFPEFDNIAFLQKPFTAEQLTAAVEKHFEVARG